MGQQRTKDLNTRGFTLMEVVVVMAILTILVGVAVPSLSAYYRHSQETERAGQEELAGKALRQYYAFEGGFPDLADLAPADGEKQLTDAQAGELQRTLRTVTSVRINIADYTYIYNEETGACRLTRK